MTEQELLEKIEKVSNGDWKRKAYIINTLNCVLDNFDKLAPRITMYHYTKQQKKLEVKIDGIPTQDYGTSNSQTCYNKNYTMQYGNTAEYVNSATGKCKDKEDKER